MLQKSKPDTPLFLIPCLLTYLLTLCIHASFPFCFSAILSGSQSLKTIWPFQPPELGTKQNALLHDYLMVGFILYIATKTDEGTIPTQHLKVHSFYWIFYVFTFQMLFLSPNPFPPFPPNASMKVLPLPTTLSHLSNLAFTYTGKMSFCWTKSLSSH